MAGSTDRRCRLCSANDQEALIEHLAERIWEFERADLPHWPEAGDYWQGRYRDHARVFVQEARR